MRLLLILFSILCNYLIKAQDGNPSYFMGNTIMYTNQIRADGIIISDSSDVLIDIEHLNYYNIEQLNTYQLNVGYLNQNIGYKFSYQYNQENVYRIHQLQIGIQKQLSSNCIANIMLGTSFRSFLVQYKPDVLYGIALRYTINKQWSIHQETSRKSNFNRQFKTEHHSAIQYKILNQFSTLIQLDYTDHFEGRIGLLLDYWELKVQISHRYIQNRIELGVGYFYKQMDFNFIYSYHDVLGGQSYAKIQIKL